jgi:ADP-ribose pyrophosphatase YjhB (NUDIX family)
MNQKGPTANSPASAEEEPIRIRAVAIIARDGKVLFLRHRHPDPEREYWVVPGGGVLPGETAAQAVVREVREEIQAEARVVRLLYVSDRPHCPEERELGLYFLCDIGNATPNPSSELLTREGYVDELVFADPAEVVRLRLFPEFLRRVLPADAAAGFAGPTQYVEGE